MDFINVAQATLRFSSHALTIDGVTIPTKICKLKPGAHSICNRFSSKAYLVPPRTSKAVSFKVPLNPLGDAHVKEGDLVRVAPLSATDEDGDEVLIPHCISKVHKGHINYLELQASNCQLTGAS